MKERVLKMSSLIDQQDESELLPPPATEEDKWYQNFIVSMGSQPDEAEEPTSAQLAALHKRVYVENRSPYCDFSVWVPFERRMSRVQKCRVYTPLGNGFLPTEGPPWPEHVDGLEGIVASFPDGMHNAQHLLDCSTGDILPPGGEAAHPMAEVLGTHIPGRRWSPGRKAGEGLRRRLTIESAQNRQVPRDWDPMKPWSCVFAQVASDMEYWAEGVHHPGSILDGRRRQRRTSGGDRGSGARGDTRWTKGNGQ